MSETVFLLAGEASGDRIGAALMNGLRQRVEDLRFAGVGGDAMGAAGLSSIFPMDDLAVMGFGDVLKRLPLLLWRARQTVRAILDLDPEMVVLIDAQVFSQTVARALRRKGYRKPILLYVAPAVWAWKPGRARKIAPLYDEVLAVLPFEPAEMARLGGPATSYVGHPALQRFALRADQPEKGPLLLLPGSRAGELRRHLPLMKEVAAALAGHPAVTGFIVPTLSGLHPRLEAETASWPAPVTIVSGEEERREALETAIAALAVSGTATLELALAGVPQIITYVAEGAQVRLFESATVDRIGLPNIVLGRDLAPEVLFAHRGEPKRVVEALVPLLERADARAGQAGDCARLRELMEKGAPEAPLHDASDRVLFWLYRSEMST